MPTITVTDATHRLIRAAATSPFKNTATRLPDGRWEVPVGDDTLARLTQIQLAGETMDGTIERLVRTQAGVN